MPLSLRPDSLVEVTRLVVHRGIRGVNMPEWHSDDAPYHIGEAGFVPESLATVGPAEGGEGGPDLGFGAVDSVLITL